MTNMCSHQSARFRIELDILISLIAAKTIIFLFVSLDALSFGTASLTFLTCSYELASLAELVVEHTGCKL